MRKYDFAVAFRRAFDNGGLTQKELAEITGIPQPTLSQWVNGRREPSLSGAVLLANALGISLDELVGRKPRPSKDATYIENVYQSLNERGKASLHEQADMHLANPLYKKRDSTMETA